MTIPKYVLVLSVFISSVSFAQKVETISFPSTDSLEITADLYMLSEEKPYMLLCHQAGFSRAEYKETAIVFTQLGYNCLAIDQRSGNAVYKIINETAKRATEKGLRRMYIDAYQDMEASLKYLYKKSNKKVVVIGSSYSAALVFKLAIDYPEMISAILAYSPGEYIKGYSVRQWISKTTSPVFITSSKAEIPVIKMLIEEANNKKLIHFEPKETGIHGTKALWETTSNNKAYWSATLRFLTNLKEE